MNLRQRYINFLLFAHTDLVAASYETLGSSESEQYIYMLPTSYAGPTHMRKQQ